VGRVVAGQQEDLGGPRDRDEQLYLVDRQGEFLALLVIEPVDPSGERPDDLALRPVGRQEVEQVVGRGEE